MKQRRWDMGVALVGEDTLRVIVRNMYGPLQVTGNKKCRIGRQAILDDSNSFL